MSTASTFTKTVEIYDIPRPAMSVAAHLGAKLELFQTDERTLTDELCDMLCMWLAMKGAHSTHAIHSPFSFKLTLSKTTTAVEVKNGADLELVVASPLGSKRCLMQAKVLDPKSGKLRCDSPNGWKKLRKQLVSMRDQVGALAFLLIYVPSSRLNGKRYGYSTYEQNQPIAASGSSPAFYGATLVPVDELLGPSGRWRSTKFKVRQNGAGTFRGGVPLWRCLIELLLCLRGSWGETEASDSGTRLPAFRTLALGASEITVDRWGELQRGAREWLPSDDAADRDDNVA